MAATIGSLVSGRNHGSQPRDIQERRIMTGADSRMMTGGSCAPPWPCPPPPRQSGSSPMPSLPMRPITGKHRINRLTAWLEAELERGRRRRAAVERACDRAPVAGFRPQGFPQMC